jgi:hypothetical protein
MDTPPASMILINSYSCSDLVSSPSLLTSMPTIQPEHIAIKSGIPARNLSVVLYIQAFG